MVTRWWPETYGELAEAAAAGVLVESHSLDLKRELEPGDRGNRSRATDLAAFAVDGGVLVIGVAEGNPPTISPVELAGQRERIDQVARTRIDGPLAVQVVELRSPDDPARGCLVVVVPASPEAPHMVDNRYMGRGDSTNVRLDDAAVRRLHAQRALRVDRMEALLEAEVRRDPIAPDARQNGHIFVVAQPAFAPAEMLESAVGDWQAWMNRLRNLPTLKAQFAPDLERLGEVRRRPAGWALTNLEATRSLRDGRDEGLALDVEVNEDGGVRIFCGRGSDTARDTTDQRYVFPAIAYGMAWRAVQAAAAVAETTRYVGTWDLAFAITRIRGARPYLGQRFFASDSAPYAEDEYRATTAATHAEIAGDRAPVVQRLVGRFNRALTRGGWTDEGESA
jgi:hypothetical protein